MKKYIHVLALFLTSLLCFGCADSGDGTCQMPQNRCSAAGIPQICMNGLWLDQAPCGANSVCNAGICTAAPCTGPGCQTPPALCTDNSRQCSQTGVPQICTAGQWFDMPPCTVNQICSNGLCTDATCTGPNCNPSGPVTVCNDGQKQCVQNIPQVCAAGSWTSLTPCSATQDCLDGVCIDKPCTDPSCMTPPPVCTDNAVQCSAAGIPQLCITGQWIDKTPCSNGQTCINGACETTSTDPTCNANACQTAAHYYGNACITTSGNTQTCGCLTDKDCNSTYACNKDENICELICSDAICAAQTTKYEGNLCITQTEEDVTESFCGCNEDSDCRDGYTCYDVLNICTLSCVDSACAAASTKDYAGNLCVKHYMNDGVGDEDDYYIECGCNSDNDCRDNYTCNMEFNFCIEKGKETGSCSQDACKAAPDATYHGNICIFSDYSSSYDCGCNSDSDCRGDFICNYMNQCIIEKDISECKTDNDCVNKPDATYYGNVCKTDSYDNGKKTYTFCGCSKDADCKKGYLCNIPQETCVKEGEETFTCMPSYCEKATPYEGNTCVDFFGDIICGCYSNADCKTGYFCDLDYLECTK